LEPSERQRAVLLFFLIFVTAILDMLGVASILPFIAVLTNPEIIEKNIFLLYIYDFTKNFGVENTSEFLFILGLIVFLLLVISLSFRVLTTYGQMRFTYMQEYLIGRKLIEGYLHQPYKWFLNKHSADLSKNILSEVKEIIEKIILSIIDVFVHGFTIIALLLLLLIVNFELALNIGLILVSTYLLIFFIMRNHLSKIGIERAQVNIDRFTIVNEAFSAVKDIKVKGLENEYISRFSRSAEIYARNQSIAAIVSKLPRYFIEAIAFGGMIILVLVLMGTGNSFLNILPIIALYAFAGYRLIPSLQIMYGSFTLIKFMVPTLDRLYYDLINLDKYKKQKKQDLTLRLKKSITFNNVFFKYLNKEKQTLKNINFSILTNTKVGIVGKTGSGKTTIVDLILGLIQPDEGTICVDDNIIVHENIRSWQNNIGYVPQEIYLSDASISENIAFGVEKEDINQNQIEQASKIANLHDFVIKELSEGYNTKVGERGVRLSGGQRQRIGIARALYHRPQLLILDESTSALDSITEEAVMDAINNLDKKITIVMIAHRLTTVKNCDKIFLLNQGELYSQGSYDELKKTNYIFKEMTKNND
jgi:ATP-binding cassette, subfamily B, bacterial PglK